MKKTPRPVKTNLQEIIRRLNEYWAGYGCAVTPNYDVEMGAGTFHPYTFFGALHPKPWRVAYVAPSRRPTDGRYGDNPLRLAAYYQYQVLLKPAPPDGQALYLTSLKQLGVNLARHDVRFVEDDWESPTLGAWGLGWEVWLDSLEITQFTYFQQVGGVDPDEVSLELTYGLERIGLFLQQKSNVFDLQWNDQWTYRDLHHAREREFSRFNFEEADVPSCRSQFEQCEAMARRLLAKKLLFPAYDMVLKCSHLFNLLDARNAVSATDRPRTIKSVRDLANACAVLYREKNS